mmetsp:Transcript_34673/g.56516  ORF Transcript_34673/g.56516 Transcript_34673/m.56516 type:complete len:295 (+) Transcript_34673:499-1383(+)
MVILSFRDAHSTIVCQHLQRKIRFLIHAFRKRHFRLLTIRVGRRRSSRSTNLDWYGRRRYDIRERILAGSKRRITKQLFNVNRIKMERRLQHILGLYAHFLLARINHKIESRHCSLLCARILRLFKLLHRLGSILQLVELLFGRQPQLTLRGRQFRRQPFMHQILLLERLLAGRLEQRQKQRHIIVQHGRAFTRQLAIHAGKHLLRELHAILGNQVENRTKTILERHARHTATAKQESHQKRAIHDMKALLFLEQQIIAMNTRIKQRQNILVALEKLDMTIQVTLVRVNRDKQR